MDQIMMTQTSFISSSHYYIPDTNYTITAGDFNTVIDPQIDRRNSEATTYPIISDHAPISFTLNTPPRINYFSR